LTSSVRDKSSSIIRIFTCDFHPACHFDGLWD
jgi:hypothetical protein